MGEIKIKYIGAVVAMALVFSIYVGVNAKETKVEPVEKVVVNQTWYFRALVDNDPTNPANYSTTPDPQKPCDEELEVICQITAPANPSAPSQPDMSAEVTDADQTVLEQIIDAKDNLNHNETVTAFRTE